MELDAVVDQMEEIAPPPGGLAAAPPPLPPKKFSPAMYVVAVTVVALMGGLGIAAGSFLLGGSGAETHPAAAPTVAPDEPTADAADEGDAPPAETEEGAAEPDVVQLEEVVFDE